MRHYRLTPAAAQDLSAIWDYTDQQWDVRQAEIYIGELRAAIERVTENPDLGRRLASERQPLRHHGRL